MIKVNWKAIVAWVKKIMEAFKKKKGDGTMKTVLVLAVICFGLMMPWQVKAEDNPITLPEEFTAKQGMLMTYGDQHLLHSTTFEAAQTKESENWPKWANMLWNGWTIDVGFLYDASGADNAVIGLSRTVGTLANYLPIDFPILQKFKVSITPLALVAKDFTTDVNFDGAFGGSYVQVGVKF